MVQAVKFSDLFTSHADFLRRVADLPSLVETDQHAPTIEARPAQLLAPVATRKMKMTVTTTRTMA